MDVTPGPQLRWAIVKAEEIIAAFDRDVREWHGNPELPAPNWEHWATGLRIHLGDMLPLVRP